ncbi:MAG: TolC family protein [Flavobacteriaceae bacterium]|nr:TolC family protein [Flavobacteriaceae bacterium]
MNRYIFIFLVSFSAALSAQEVLQPEEAMNMALENNFGILVSKNDQAQAKNNASILNSRFLPSVTATTGANIAIDDQVATFQDGQTRTVDGAETTRYNASVNMNFTLFDGMGRLYNFKRLKEQYELSKLGVRQTIEQTLIQLFSAYYEVARLEEGVLILEQTFENSKRRLERADKRFEFGSSTRLDLLNARVDLNTDSINLIQQRQALTNAKRNLNVILARDLETDFTVNPLVRFVDDEVLLEKRKEYTAKNVRLLQVRSNEKINTLTLKAQRSTLLPSLAVNSGYGYSEGVFPPTGFVASSQVVGLSAGATLSWNLFNQGSQQVGIKNAKIALASTELQEKQIEQEVLRDLLNAEGAYRNAVEVYRLQQENVVTASDNFERSKNQFDLGQITSIELRQAQINLLNAELTGVQAKFSAKLAELEYLNQCGALLDVSLN